MPILCRSASWYQKLTAMHIKIRIMTTPIWNCAAAWFTNENLNDPSSRSSTAPSPWSSWLFNDPLQCIVNQDLFAATVRGAKSSHRSIHKDVFLKHFLLANVTPLEEIPTLPLAVSVTMTITTTTLPQWLRGRRCEKPRRRSLSLRRRRPILQCPAELQRLRRWWLV